MNIKENLKSSDVRISIFIPAYNAGKFLGDVIERIPDSCWSKVLKVFIINDGSSDDTQEVIEKLERSKSQIQGYSFSSNKGYGSVVRKGIELCISTDCTYAVCLHGDGQYPPEKIPEFISYMYSNHIDILQGSRHAQNTALKGGMPLYKYFAGKFLTLLENFVFGLSMTDYHSGYLLYSKRALLAVPFEHLSKSFDFDLEVIASAKSLNLKIDEQPIPTRYADEESYLNPINYGFRVLYVLWKYLRGYYKKLILNSTISHPL